MGTGTVYFNNVYLVILNKFKAVQVESWYSFIDLSFYWVLGLLKSFTLIWKLNLSAGKSIWPWLIKSRKCSYHVSLSWSTNWSGATLSAYVGLSFLAWRVLYGNIGLEPLAIYGYFQELLWERTNTRLRILIMYMVTWRDSNSRLWVFHCMTIQNQYR